FKVTMYEADEDFDPENLKQLDIQKYADELGLAEPLFRGAILGTYENDTWRQSDRDPDYPQDLMVWNIFRNDPSSTLRDESGERESGVVQEYELAPLETKTLFTMGAVRGAGAIPWATPASQGRGSRRRPRLPVNVNYDAVTHEIRYESDHDPRGFRYFILSPRSPRMVSHPNRIQRIILPQDDSLEISPDLHRLTTKAWEIVGREPDKESQSFNPRLRNRFRLSEDESRRRAEKLRNYLGDNPEYTYRLGAPVVDPALDPVEDFVLNRKAGHCEYFASALALMLRSVNIPSRVVTGFKGGISNEEDLSLTILQRHAHAWVEAYVGNRWVTYDPTPAAEEAVQSSSQISLWETARRLVSDTWNNYIINMRLEDQSSIATPVFELTRRQLNGGTLASFVSWVIMVVSTPRLWLTWQGGLLLLMIGFTILAIRFAFFLIKRIGTRLLVTFNKAESQRSSGVDFYEKFLAIMASRGLRPFPWQTQREFASVSLGQVPVTAERRKTLSDLISRLFYQVRFGGRSLSDSVKGDLQTELQSLESDLKTADRTPTEKAAK
ncbi:MAG: transglutaminase domain-containing protein, partial [Planctomycetaceae bacterium]|nr:transglutaminase domain-containing protein [Planctomycetaceae bacterium]